MEEALKGPGWDGEWFVRAYDAASNPVGSRSCAEGQIFIEPQGMCVMAGVGLDDGKAVRALVVRPPVPALHRVGAEPGGQAGVHRQPLRRGLHPQDVLADVHKGPWISIAETVAGRGDNAFDIYRRTCPVYQEEHSEVRRVEPYVYRLPTGLDAAS